MKRGPYRWKREVGPDQISEVVREIARPFTIRTGALELPPEIAKEVDRRAEAARRARDAEERQVREAVFRGLAGGAGR